MSTNVNTPPLTKEDQRSQKRMAKLKLQELQQAHQAAKARGGNLAIGGSKVSCKKAKAALQVKVESTHPAVREVTKAWIVFGANGGSLRKTVAGAALPDRGTTWAYLPLTSPATVQVSAALFDTDGIFFEIAKAIDVVVPAGEMVKAIIRVTPLARPKVKVKREDGTKMPGVGVKIGNLYDLGQTLPDEIAKLADTHGGTKPGTFGVAFTFPTEPGRWELIDDRQIVVAAASLDTYEFTVRKLARPRVKVVREDNGKVVPDVRVKLDDAYDLGLTGKDGVAKQKDADPGVKEGTYGVKLILKGKVLETYVTVDATPTIDVARGSEAEYIIKVKTASLLVIVRRADGKPLPKRVKFDLAGTSPLTDQESVACNDPDDKRDEKKLTGIAPGNYTVTIKNLATVQTDQKADPLSLERWTVGPDKTGKAKVTVTASETAKVEFTLTKYRKIQFIAFDIMPGTKKVSGVDMYLGEKSATADYKKRCDIMKEAIKKAYIHGNVEKADSAVLKVFMAPEFYYRGEDGAYPIEQVNEILGEMKSESSKGIYDDWLFVYGTAIGYLRHEDSATKNVKIKADPTGTAVVLVDGDTDKLSTTGIPNGLTPGWRLKQNDIEYAIKSCNIVVLVPAEYSLTLGAVAGLKKGDCQLIQEKTQVYTLSITGALTTAIQKVRVTNEKDKASLCGRIPAGAAAPWQVKQGLTVKSIVKATKINDNEYDLDLDSAAIFTDGKVELLETISTEVFNVALAQKGGDGKGSTGMREVAVYKEFVSAIDFLGSNYGKHDSSGGEFHDPTGVGRKIAIHDNPSRPVLPTMGADDLLGGTPNLTSEVNNTGIGGGSVFMMEGISFGLEICRDHLVGRLQKYYKNRATSGEPDVQVLLIPSWGAYIDNDGLTGIPNALVFNEDGPSGADAGVLEGFECATHPGLVRRAGVCAQPDDYYCDIKPHPQPGPGNCTQCSKPLAEVIDYYTCPRTNHVAATNPCPCGNTSVKKLYQCPNPRIFTAAGSCPCCGKPLQAAGVGRYVCKFSHLNLASGLCACGKTRADSGKYVCDKVHRFNTPGACADCSTGLNKHVASYKCEEDFHIYSSGPNCTLCSTPLKEWHKPLKPKVTKLTAETDQPEVPDPGSCKQDDLFEKKQSTSANAKGHIVVYPVQDIPEAEMV